MARRPTKPAPKDSAPVKEWSSDFGTDYQARNASSWQSTKNRSRLFGDIFQAMENANKADPKPKAFPESVIEVGGGCGGEAEYRDDHFR